MPSVMTETALLCTKYKYSTVVTSRANSTDLQEQMAVDTVELDLNLTAQI